MFGKIGVFMGGPSREREISLKSGVAVIAALTELGLEVAGINIKTDDPQEAISAVRRQKIDCAFLALHGRFGEDGTIQEILEAIKIPYTGSGVAASRLAMDKSAALKLFKDCGLSVPDYQVIEKRERGSAAALSLRFGLPLVIKPAAEGSSIGLSIIRNLEEFEQAVDFAFSSQNKIITSVYVPGREMTVGILNEDPLPVVEIIPKKEFFDYEAKYKQGMTSYEVPAKLDNGVAENIKSAALSAHKALGCFGCSRVDIILSPDNLPYILEVNTIPGMTATSLLPKAANAAGIGFAALCLKLIDSAYEKK
ncbi:MAG: D-alanine--D-alanine ligase [Candidatus Omnitrophota bacterium]|nr:D-alanine--D-alanine ligase [Candidatus Omnitrophota bacterium]